MLSNTARFSSRLASLSCALVLAGCGSSATTATSPTTLTRCSVDATGGGSLPAAGGSGTIAVSAARECTWSASTEGQWLAIRSGATGQGEGTVEFAAVANPDPVSRRGAVVLNEKRVEVTQAPGECSFSLTSSSGTYPPEGGPGGVGVRASSALCEWSAQADVDWIILRGPQAQRGSADLSFDVLPASGLPRAGTIRAAGLQFGVTQTQGCAYSISPTFYEARAEGGSGTISVTTTAACPWTATSGVPWMTFAPAAGAGPGTITFEVAPGAVARAGSATVAGQPFSVSQGAPAPNPVPSPAPPPPPVPGPPTPPPPTPDPGPPAPPPPPAPEPPAPPSCSYAVAPLTHAIGASGGTVNVRVTTREGCAWGASSSLDWVSLSGGASAAGEGTATFAVAATSGAARSGTVTVAGQGVVINQAGACTFSLSSPGSSAPAAGGTGTVGVSAASGCAWTASSGATWLTITSGAAGTGNGPVSFSAAPNDGTSRTGTLTIAGQTFTVTQPGTTQSACSYTVRPSEVEITRQGRALRIAVTTSNNCSWTASTTASWLEIVSGTGTGSADVVLNIAANPGGERVGTLQVADQVVTITQR